MADSDRSLSTAILPNEFPAYLPTLNHTDARPSVRGTGVLSFVLAESEEFEPS